MKVLCLIDGYSIIYQSHYAFINRPLFNPQGKNSSAVFGFFRTYFGLLRNCDPSHCAVIMDSKVPTFRHEQYHLYKAQRDKAPQELYDQVAVIEEILSALGLPFYRVEGFEADDLIATLARRSVVSGLECLVVSRDKDILQTIGKDVRVLRQRKADSGFDTWGRKEVFDNLGVYPEQIIDYLALIGDQSDNIPGVSGIGPKTAVKLLAQYKNLESIYENLDTIPQAQREKLAAGRDNAFLSKNLVTLCTEVPLEVMPEELELKPLALDKAIPLFLREGMKTLVQELGGDFYKEKNLTEATPGAYTTITDEKGLEKIIARIRQNRIFAFDTETDSINDMKAIPVGISLACESGSGYYIPLKARGVSCCAEETVYRLLKPILEDSSLLLVGQNIKYDYKVLKRQGITIANRLFDTMIAAWVLESEGIGSYSLDALAERYLSYKTIKYADVVEKGSGLNLSQVDIEKAADYAGEDADIALRLYQFFDPLLKELHLDELFRTIEMPMVRILAEMELAGIRVFPDRLAALDKELVERIAVAEKEIFSLAGKEFNLNSPKQLAEVLFSDLKLKPIKKIKTGFSTDNQVLEILAQDDLQGAVPRLILEHRSLAKLKNTYIDTLPGLVNPATGKIHTQYLQTGTATGRLSSKDPNLQNIPIRDETGRKIRIAFVPEAGCLFLSADYSQIELVVLAHLSGDPLLIEAFQKGLDIHALTASIIFKKDTASVTPEERRMGKTINFGVMYGMSPFRLAQDYKISRKEATEFINAYFERYTGVTAYRETVIREAQKNLFAATLMGRRRKIPTIGSSNKMERNSAERIAFNTTIQGSAADIVKCAMRDISSFLTNRGSASHLLLQVHDELVLQVPENEVPMMTTQVKRIMESVVRLKVPLRVNIETGSSWGTIH